MDQFLVFLLISRIMNISLEDITIDQSKVADHFDRAPIYGTLNSKK